MGVETKLCLRYGREEATLRKSVCFDELKKEVRKIGDGKNMSTGERDGAGGYRSKLKTRGREKRENNCEVMARKKTNRLRLEEVTNACLIGRAKPPSFRGIEEWGRIVVRTI